MQTKTINSGDIVLLSEVVSEKNIDMQGSVADSVYGKGGATFTPVVNTPKPHALLIGWQNDHGLPNPDPVAISVPRGENGDPFRCADFTPEQLEGLKVKGDKGDDGEIPDVSNFQTVSDEALTTADKTIVGAINEVAAKPTGVYVNGNTVEEHVLGDDVAKGDLVMSYYEYDFEPSNKLPALEAFPYTGQSCSFSPDGLYLAVGHFDSPYITVYKCANPYKILVCPKIRRSDSTTSKGIALEDGSKGETSRILITEKY